MKALEEGAFARGITAESLMDEAGEQIAAAVRQFFPEPGECLVFFGKGHNGGDALAAARHLAAARWRCMLVPAFPKEAWSPLSRTKFEQAHGCPLGSPEELHRALHALGRGPLVVLDGLLGIGARRTLSGPLLAAAQQIGRIRQEHHARVFAIDLPTGMDADSGETDPEAVVADFTLTIGFAKKGLLEDAAANHAGRIAVLPLTALSAPAVESVSETVATRAALALGFPFRKHDSHKGECGRVGIIAGSPGFTGAAIMSATAALRAGAGLVTLYATREILSILVAGAPPEVMVQPVEDYRDVLRATQDVLAVGPGLGTNPLYRKSVQALVVQWAKPMVLDADGLNITAERPEMLLRCAGPRLLTPHPGEMARLDPSSKGNPRRDIVRAFTTRYPVTLLLKGSRTIITERDRPLSYNTTGNAGMASGGMGDTLTGVCAALIGQGLSPYDAARTGAWLCGRAAELAISCGSESEESLTATTVSSYLGRAFHALRAAGY